MSPLLSQVPFSLQELAESSCSLVVLLCGNTGSITKQLKIWCLCDLPFISLRHWGFSGADQCPSSLDKEAIAHHITIPLLFHTIPADSVPALGLFLHHLTQQALLEVHFYKAAPDFDPNVPLHHYGYATGISTCACGSRHVVCVPPAQQLHFHLLQLSVASFESSFTPTGASLAAQALFGLTTKKVSF